MRIRRLAAGLALGTLAFGMVAQTSAQAMTDNAKADGVAHPAVVALLYVNSTGDGVFAYCSGMLIAPQVVLTASHCNAGTAAYAARMTWKLAVTNESWLGVADNDGWLPLPHALAYVRDGGVVENPLYKKGYRDDVTVQLIATELPGVAGNDLGVLPAPGLLDDMKADKVLRGLPLRVLGYGTEAKTTPANTSPTFPDSNERRYADLPTIALDKQWIHQDQNVGKNPDQAGACYGDSGGPSLITSGGTNVVVGVTSTGDGPCFATNVSSRVDTPEALAFVKGFLP